MLTGPLNAFPWALNGLVESFVSIKRIGQLLALSKIDPEKYFSPITDLVDEVLCLTLIKVCPTPQKLEGPLLFIFKKCFFKKSVSDSNFMPGS